MELGILGGLALIGNAVNKKKNIINNDIQNTDDHHVDLTYHNSKNEVYKKNINKIIDKNLIQKSKHPERTNIINNSVKSINNIYPNYNDMNSNFYEENVKNLNNIEMSENFTNSINNNDMSYEDQFKTLKFDNKNKPKSASSNISQNDRIKLNSIERNLALGNEFTLFDKESVDMTYGIECGENFTHSNMVPHFSKRQMINDYNEQTLSHKVEVFSGSSKNFDPKKEIRQEHFTPLQRDVNLVNGSKSNTDFLQSYYQPGKERRNELPFEQDYIGPGLNLDPNQSIRPDGGNFEEYRPLPKTSDQLRSADRPKISYEGRVIEGKKGDEGSTIGKVYKRRPEKFVELDPSNMLQSGGEYKKPMSDKNFIIKDNARKNSKLFIGPAKANDERSSGKNNQIVRLSDKESKSIDPSNVEYLVKKATDKTCYKLNPTRRVTTNNDKYTSHPHKFSLSKVKFDPHDLPRQTIKQTTIFNEQSGYAKGIQNTNKSYNPDDTARTTKKQLTQYVDQAGYAKGIENNTISFNPNDSANTTIRQDTGYNEQAGYAKAHENFTVSFNPNNTTRPTGREDTGFNEQAGYAKGHENFPVSYNPNDTTNTTIRQDTLYNDQAGMAKGHENFPISYNPTDVSNTTKRQEMSYTDQSGSYKGHENFPVSYNPNDLANSTIRQETMYNEQSGMAKGLQNKPVKYDPNDIANTTIRQETYVNDSSNLKQPGGTTISFNPNDVANPTIRQETLHNEQGGYAKGQQNFTVSYNPNDLTNPTNRQENSYTEQSGYAKGHENSTISYNPNDLANPTIRQELTHNENGGVAKGHENFTVSYNPNDILETTQRQDLAYNKDILNTRHEVNMGEAFNPNDLLNSTNRQTTSHSIQDSNLKSDIDKPNYYNSRDLPRPTIKQDTIFSDRSGQMEGSNMKPKTFNPYDVPDKTLKDFLINTYELGVAQGQINKSKTFNPSDIPAETLKDMMIHTAHITNPNREQSSGYLTNKQYAPETLRQLIQILRFGGALGDIAPRDYSSAENMQIDDKKEMLLKNRAPTLRKHDVIPQEGNIGDVSLREPINIIRQPNIARENSQYNNFNLASKYRSPNTRNDETNRLNPEILTQLNDNPLVNNLVISQIIDDHDNKNC